MFQDNIFRFEASCVEVDRYLRLSRGNLVQIVAPMVGDENYEACQSRIMPKYGRGVAPAPDT